MVVVEFRVTHSLDEAAQKALLREIVDTGVHCHSAEVDPDGHVRIELVGEDWEDFGELRTWLSGLGVDAPAVGIAPDPPDGRLTSP